MNYFSIDWEYHHPNWRTHIFQMGSSTTNQRVCSKSSRLSTIINVRWLLFNIRFPFFHIHHGPGQPPTRYIHTYIYIYYNATSLRPQETLRVWSHRSQLQESLLQILVQPLELVNQVPRSPGVHRVKKRTMFGSSLGSSHLMIICLVVWNHGISWWIYG